MKYNTRNSFRNGSGGAYKYAKRNNLLDSMCSHMERPYININNHTTISHLCRYCGEDNPVNFYKTSKSTCKSCQSNNTTIRYHKLSIEEKLKYKNNLITWQNSNIFRVRYSVGKHRATKNNFEFEITEDFLKQLYEKQNGLCFYSNIPMSLIQDNHLYSVSIERKNSSFGYTKNNVVLCCSSVNRMKNKLEENEFLFIISEIYKKNFTNV